MTAQKDPYVRVYYSIKADPKFRGIYRDDRALGCWLRLLITADASHPAPAEFPMGTDMDNVQRLVDAGLVDVVDDGLYQIHGLENERTKRSSDARSAARARWTDAPASGSDATAMRPHVHADAQDMRPHTDAMRAHGDNGVVSMPLRSSPLRSEPSNSEPSSAIAREADAMDTYYRLTGSWPSAKVIPWINQMVADHSEEAVSEALAKVWTEDPDRATLMSRVRDRLERESHERAKAYEKAEAQRAARERKEIETMPEEQRRANMARLRDALTSKGLIEEAK